MEDNIPGFPGYHISKEGKLYNKGHPVKTFYHKRYERTKLRNGNLSKNVKIHRFGIESPNASLSLRKVRRIDRLKLRGNTNRYIAKRLRVSNATIGNYLKGIYYKN